MTPERDFPAAHSMDTEWFAVDADGHVAVFVSGEAGAMPEEAGEADPDICADLEERLEEVEPIYDPASVGDSLWMLERAGETEAGNLVVFARDRAAFAPDLESGAASEVRAVSGAAAHYHRLAPEVASRLLASGAITGVAWLDDEDLQNLARRGFFVFEHLDRFENWISGPYGRRSVPSRPLSIDDLSPADRRRVAGAAFSTLRFADVPLLQPAEHAEVVSWQSAWVASDGKTVRPIPGQEDGYLDDYQNRDADDGLDWQPPTAVDAGEPPDPDAPDLPPTVRSFLARLFRRKP